MRLIAFALVFWFAHPAQAQRRFAVIDVTPGADTEALVSSVEKEIVRLDPGCAPLVDPIMRRILASGETPTDTALRLATEARAAFDKNDCGVALPRARAAETAVLNTLSLDDERDVLRDIYKIQVTCEAKLGDSPALKVASARLRALTTSPPDDFPLELWEQHVANATPGTPTTELQVDTEPGNAQVSINFRGEGVTPRTLKVAPGLVFIEVQKEGYKKGFRAVEVRPGIAGRAVFRLIARSQDRVEQAIAQMGLVRTSEGDKRPATLSRVADLARVDMLVLLARQGSEVSLRFFDTERGALTGEPIVSPYDPSTGTVKALAERTTPAAPAAQKQPADNAPSKAATPGSAPMPNMTAEQSPSALPEAQAKEQYAQYRQRPKKEIGPWWGWAIAGGVAVAFGAFLFLDRPTQSKDIGVTARWSGPRD